MTDSQSRPIRILHLITSLEVGGAETMLLKLVRQMDRHAFHNRVVCMTSEGPIGNRIRRAGISVTYLKMPRGRLTLKGTWLLFRELKFYRPEILQCWLYHSDLLGLVIGKLVGVQTILWNLRCAYIDLTRYRLSTRIVLKICSLLSFIPQAIISNSDDAISYHKAMGYRSRSWHLIPNGVDTELFSPNRHAKEAFLKKLGVDLSLPENQVPHETPILVGCVARFDPMKDYRTLAEAAKIVVRECDKVLFVLVGRDVDWENPFFRNIIPDLLRPRFFLLGERDDMPRIMAAFDIFLLTSYGEGFPNVLCEAMAAGVPCVATDVGDCRNVIANTGFVVPPKNPLQTSEAVKKLVQATSQERRQLGESARQRVLEHYTIAAVTQRYETLYRSFKQPLSLP